MINHDQYTDSTEPGLDLSDEFIDVRDAQRSIGEALEYLLKHLIPGLLFVRRRSKLLIIAAGHVQTTSFHLPSLADYWLVII